MTMYFFSQFHCHHRAFVVTHAASSTVLPPTLSFAIDKSRVSASRSNKEHQIKVFNTIKLCNHNKHRFIIEYLLVLGLVKSALLLWLSTSTKHCNAPLRVIALGGWYTLGGLFYCILFKNYISVQAI